MNFQTKPGTKASSVREYALAYVSHPINWKLCRLREKSKAPMLAEWNIRIIDDGNFNQVWFDKDECGVGLVHDASGTGALDVDNVEWSRFVFAEFGISFDDLLAGYPRIKGRDNHDKIIFKLPAGIDASTHKLVWPGQNPGDKPITVFELRAKGGQDVLPPSIHPDTNLPYEWLVSPFVFKDGIPEAPKELIQLWKSWPTFEKQFKNLCPWAQPTEQPREVVRQLNKPSQGIISQFNNSVDIVELLETSGYQKRGNRYLSPTSSSGIPGVVIFKNSGKCYSHHASDPLSDGFAHDAFDVFTKLACHGDITVALKEAKRRLGIETRPDPNITAMLDKIAARKFQDEFKEKYDISIKELEKKSPTEFKIKEYKIKPVTPFPLQDLNIVAEWINGYSEVECPAITQMACLALTSVCASRNYVTPFGDPCSLFMVGVSNSIGGIRYVHTALQEILIKSGQQKIIRTNRFSSPSAIFKHLHKTPTCIYLSNDIAGLSAFARRQPSGAQEYVLNILSQLYSGSDYIINAADEFGIKSNQEATIIYSPALSIVGLAAIEQLTILIRASEINRGASEQTLFVIDDEDDNIVHEPKPASVPDFLINKILKIITSENKFENNPELPPTPVVVHFNESLDPYYRQLQAATNLRQMAPIVRSSRTILRRMAASLAVWANPGAPVAGTAILEWCTDFISTRISDLSEKFTIYNTEDGKRGPYDYVAEKILYAKNEGISKGDLSRYCKPYKNLTEKAREELIEQILADGVAVFVDIKTKSGQISKRLIHTKYATEK